MVTRSAALGILICALLAPMCQGQGPGSELEKLLDQALRVEAKKARLVLQRALGMLEEEGKDLTVADRERLAAKLARAIQKAARKPAELRVVLGEKAAWSIARQAFYRRYREQWLLESPLRLLATFDCPQGQEPVLVSVRPLRGEP